MDTGSGPASDDRVNAGTGDGLGRDEDEGVYYDQAVNACDRCGNFAKSPKILMGRLACEDCLAIPGVDFLQAFKDEVWGRRDEFISLVALHLVVLLLAILGLCVLMSRGASAVNLASLAIIIVSAANAAAYVLRFTQARLNLVIFSILLPAIHIGTTIVFEGGIKPSRLGETIAQMFLGFAISLVAFRSTRNKLAFKMEVSDFDLERCYTRYRDNPLARYGSSLGVLGMLIPVFAPIGFILSIKGLRAVNAEAWPPVGNKQAAVLGLVTSSIGLLWGSFLLLALLLRL